jgi:hypothetical protein
VLLYKNDSYIIISDETNVLKKGQKGAILISGGPHLKMVEDKTSSADRPQSVEKKFSEVLKFL